MGIFGSFFRRAFEALAGYDSHGLWYMQIFKGLIHKAEAATPLFQGIYSTGDKAWVTDAQGPHSSPRLCHTSPALYPSWEGWSWGWWGCGCTRQHSSTHGKSGWLHGENQLSPTLPSMGDSCTQHPLFPIKAQVFLHGPLWWYFYVSFKPDISHS